MEEAGDADNSVAGGRGENPSDPKWDVRFVAFS